MAIIKAPPYVQTRRGYRHMFPVPTEPEIRIQIMPRRDPYPLFSVLFRVSNEYTSKSTKIFKYFFPDMVPLSGSRASAADPKTLKSRYVPERIRKAVYPSATLRLYCIQSKYYAICSIAGKVRKLQSSQANQFFVLLF